MFRPFRFIRRLMFAGFASLVALSHARSGRTSRAPRPFLPGAG